MFYHVTNIRTTNFDVWTSEWARPEPKARDGPMIIDTAADIFHAP